MPEAQPLPLSDSPRHDKCSPASTLPSYNIPQEDWDHAQALLKYPPHVILFIARELLSCHSRSSTVTATSSSEPSLRLDTDTGTSPTTRSHVREKRNIETADGTLDQPSPSNLSHDHRLAIAQLTAWEKEGLKQQENRWFCVFDEHKDTSFGKPSDWKKHMNNFHEPGKKAWQCSEKDCFQIFDKAKNFCQHHRKEHGCRKPCTHADSVKKRNMNKRAFACGCESCQRLLFSWDKWRDHVAQHMENGMTKSQWQYNTLFRNLLRRPEVHPHWEKLVVEGVYPYNVLSRFTWRPRNTGHLKTQLEYMNSSDLLEDAHRLALQAYESGTSVRSAQELSDPSPLIAEPSTVPMPLSLDHYSAPQPQNSCPGVVGVSHDHFGIPPFPLHHQEPHDFQPPFQQTPSSTPPALGDPEINFDIEHYLDQLQDNEPPFHSVNANLHNHEDVDMTGS